jgi:hypothetical protein
MADKIDINNLQNEAEGLESALRGSINAYNDLIRKNADLADDLSKINKGSDIGLKLATQLKNLNEKDILDKTKIKKLESDTNKLINEIRRNRAEVNRLEKELADPLTRNKKAISDVLKTKQSIVESDEALLDVLQNVLGVSVSISKESKYFSQLGDFINKIPIVGGTLSRPFFDISKALQEANLRGANPLVAGLKAASKSIATLSLGFFIQQAFKASSQVTNLQKSLLLSKNEAYAIRDGFIETAKASGDTFITTDKLLAANAALSEQLGFSKRFSDDLNIGFTNLTKRIGLSEKAAGGLAKASIITGKSMKSITEDASGAVSAVSAQYGIQLNVKDVLEEAGNSSALMLANFKGNPIELAKGVAQMKALGTTLEQTRKQAQGLLDFESSIKNQLEAQLFTGRQMNLERARELAMNNDLVGLQKELVNQGMKYSDFNNANAFQREAMAKAMNLTTDELSEQLLRIEMQKKSQSEILATLGKQAADRASALSAQDKFNAAVEKVSGMFANLLDGPLGKVVDLMASLASSSVAVYGTLGLIAALSFGSVINSVVSLANSLTASAIAGGALEAFINPIGLAVGIAALAGITGLVLAAVNSGSESMEDGIIGADGKVKYKGVKNSITFDKNDKVLRTPSGNIIAGTNLGGGGNDNSVVEAIAKLGDRLDQLSERPVIARPSEFAGPVTVKQIQNINRILA